MTFEEHKIRLGKLLHTNSIRPKTKRGNDIIWAYWVGVMTENGKDWPIVSICLSCGRSDELQTKPEGN